MPTVSILMPIKGDCNYLSKAIQSVLLQDYCDWEFIICADSIGMNATELITSLASFDSRLILLDTQGLNLAEALNRGIEIARGELIVRFDADDIMLPGRLKVQVKYMLREPKIVALGGQILMINESDKICGVAPYFNLRNRPIVSKIIFKCPFAHPATIIRSKSLKSVGGYNTKFKYAEDYDLWLRLSHHGKFANLLRPIIAYRTHPYQASMEHIAETKRFTALGIINELIYRKQSTNQKKETIPEINILKAFSHLTDQEKLFMHSLFQGAEFLGGLHGEVSNTGKGFRSSFLQSIQQVRRFRNQLAHLLMRLLIDLYCKVIVSYRWPSYLRKLEMHNPS